ncbi:hypothetical protein C1Y40_00111 [Mycobacterium talmoniae]|uniref:Uncharacterized protein n=1 Tax=Mycobacterium talmoniae TaxID=1858794 RepID=A0A2S8BSN0_9MYCO|nr:hypothetical protein C1Y40_00111 [Mycobacterium talmoniae]
MSRTGTPPRRRRPRGCCSAEPVRLKPGWGAARTARRPACFPGPMPVVSACTPPIRGACWINRPTGCRGGPMETGSGRAIEIAPFHSHGALKGFVIFGRWPDSTKEWAQLLIVAVRVASLPGLLSTTTVFGAREELPESPPPDTVGWCSPRAPWWVNPPLRQGISLSISARAADAAPPRRKPPRPYPSVTVRRRDVCCCPDFRTWALSTGRPGWRPKQTAP